LAVRNNVIILNFGSIPYFGIHYVHHSIFYM
jgi:hypothetical protein